MDQVTSNIDNPESDAVGQHEGFAKHDWYDSEWQALESQSNTHAMSDAETQARDTFVEEYMFDRDPIKAAIRCGFMRAHAVKIADRYMGEPYVLRAIRLAEESYDYQDKKQLNKIKKKVVNRLISEVDSFGMESDSKTRIAASTSLGKLMDMEPNKRVDIHSSGTSPVMVVPGIASIEDWEKAASDSQSKLLDDTQEEHLDE